MLNLKGAKSSQLRLSAFVSELVGICQRTCRHLSATAILKSLTWYEKPLRRYCLLQFCDNMARRKKISSKRLVQNELFSYICIKEGHLGSSRAGQCPLSLGGIKKHPTESRPINEVGENTPHATGRRPRPPGAAGRNRKKKPTVAIFSTCHHYQP